MVFGLPSDHGDSSPHSSSFPAITFHGPNDVSQIKAINPSGQEVARFILHGTDRSSYTIARVFGPNDPPTEICSAKKSSLSSHTTMFIHGQELKLKEKTESLQEVWEIKTPTTGKMTWRSASGGVMELKDERKTVVAKGSTKELKLEVFVPGDEMTMDLLLATWVAMIKKKKADTAGGGSVSAVANVIGALGGGGA